ncbi:MAG: SIS domain-containing protein [Proteobacteria bacterium]|nr:SIS domain-containing protein [Pseudomonadota bacterium]
MQAVKGFFDEHAEDIDNLAARTAACLEDGGKILLCGNGGSACDALHIAGEFVGRFVKDRRALPAMALSADAGILTAVGNDYGFEQVFSRQVEAHGNKGDILIAISTSGQSPNIIRALEVAKKRGLYTVMLTGEKGSKVKKSNLRLVVPSTVTARIQEVHIFALQLLCGLVEQKMGIGQ